MSEIPVQSQTRGAHEADTDEFTGDYGYAASDVNLDSDPFADDLSKELSHAAPKTWVNRTTLVVGGLVLIVGGFLGGIQVQKHYGKSATPSAASNIAALRSAFGNRGAAGGFPGAGGTGAGTGAGTGTGTGTGAGTGTGTRAAAAAQTGKITLVDGSTIYVTLANGTVLTVTTNSKTQVSVASTSKVGALKKGQTVTIVGGTPDSTGSVTATSVTATK